MDPVLYTLFLFVLSYSVAVACIKLLCYTVLVRSPNVLREGVVDLKTLG